MPALTLLFTSATVLMILYGCETASQNHISPYHAQRVEARRVEAHRHKTLERLAWRLAQ